MKGDAVGFKCKYEAWPCCIFVYAGTADFCHGRWEQNNANP